MAHSKHYVTFYSPGTFVSEQTTREIGAWDPKVAVGVAETITERHGATPFGFRFSTVLTADPVPDGRGGVLKVEERETGHSGIHYLGGVLHTLDEVEARALPGEETLLSNMQCNDDPIVIMGAHRWRWCHVFNEEDCIVDATGTVIERGNDKRHMEYRARKIADLARKRTGKAGG